MTAPDRVNLNRLAVFVAVVEAGSLSAAARRLGLAKTVVSTHLKRLEAELGAGLLLRTTRRLSLTDAGEAFFAASRRILRDAEAAIAEAAAHQVEPRGTLRITAPVDYAAAILSPLAAQLARRHPALRIELIAADRILDLVGEGIDLAIRIGRLADSSHQAVRIGGFAEVLVATPRFLRRAGAAASPEAIAGWPFIAMAALPHPHSWLFVAADGSRRRLRFAASLSANTASAVRAMALADGGLAILPDFIVAAELARRRLCRVLPDWTLPGGDIHAVFPAARPQPRKLRLVLDALRRGDAGLAAIRR